ncbi:hypothetical protein CHRY9393_02481 [Chryseobacterium fistulae]|uniref:Uncharacterized protein n=1 Tax=Chryseobacterium fistulae TaxID=2675058 RepID=A0A6N4XTV5_9FLAO|nr:hypothetical protein CHRY9393_02481 [Chryseobacterium fistulae]
MNYKLLTYIAFVILIIIPYFDKKDQYFFLQIICLLLIGIFGYLAMKKEKSKER